MKCNTLALQILMLAAICGPGWGAAPVMPDWNEMVGQSDLVCVVEATRVRRDIPPDHGPGSEKTIAVLQATCRVVKVFKGRSDDVLTVTDRFDTRKAEVNFAFDRVAEGDLAVLFLKSVGGGYELAHRSYPVIALHAFRVDRDDPAVPVSKRVLNQLQGDLETGDAAAVLNALAWYPELGATVPEIDLQKLANHPDVRVRAVVLTRCLDSRDDAVRTQTIHDACILLAGGGVSNAVPTEVLDLAWALDFKVGAKMPVYAANQLAGNMNPELARIGLRILMRVGNRTSVPAMVHGLKLPQMEDQYVAVRGLCRVLDREPPAWRDFMKNAAAHVREWETWWAGHSAEFVK